MLSNVCLDKIGFGVFQLHVASRTARRVARIVHWDDDDYVGNLPDEGYVAIVQALPLDQQDVLTL